MRSLSRLFFMFGIIASVAACDEEPLPTPKESESLTSRVELAAGNVWHIDGEKQQRLITGAMLAESSNLKIDPGGRALIRLDNGSGVFLRGGTSVALNAEELVIKAGEIWVDVPAGDDEMGRFIAGKVTVSASDAGLDIALTKDQVVVYVARGLAVVNGPGGRVEVGSGEQVTVKGKDPLKVAPVSFWEDWTGGMADRPSQAGVGGQGSGRIYGIDRSRPGALPNPLQITEQKVRIGIKDGIAHTVVDQTFFNPGSAQLEGWYWFTIPEGAFVDRFALEVNGALVEGEMVERKQAAAAYEEAVQKAFDPALLEWIDGRTFRARIFPIPATGERRVVLSYFELLPLSDGAYRYTYPMASAGEVTIQEFSLNVDLGDQGKDYTIRTLQDAKVEADNNKISMRRSGFEPKADFLLELVPGEKVTKPLRVMRYAAGSNEADYVMLRYAPNVDFDAQKKVSGDVVVVLDTSAGGDDADRHVRADAVEAILRALSDGDRFAVVATDLSPRVVFPKKGLAEASEKNVSSAVERLAEIPSAGATDLGEMFGTALNLLHDGNQPAVVYVGDGRATVGETSSHDLATRLKRAMGDSRARLFTIAVGADADTGLLERLARIGGGKEFTIRRPEQTVQEALRFVGMLKTPTITDLKIDAGKGLDQVFTTGAGKLSKGDELILVARTHHELPEKIEITGRLGGKPFEAPYTPEVEKGGEFGYLPLVWARQYLTRLMGDGIVENRGRIISLGLNYTMMTPYSSFLVLESNAAYEVQGIKRRQRHRFSLRQETKETAVVSAKDAFSIPLGLFGCSSLEEAPASDRAEEAEAQEKSVSMARQKLEEGRASAAVPSPNEEAKQPRARMPSTSSAELDDLLGGASGMKKSGSALAASKSQKRRSRKVDKELLAPKPQKKSKGLLGPGNANRRDVMAIPDANASQVVQPAGQIFEKGICSDASRRPLAERRILWRQRIYRNTDPTIFKEIFFDAGKRCELPRWKDRKVMLDLIEQRLKNPDQVLGFLAHFSSYPRIQRYVRKRILRRTINPQMMYGRFDPTSPDWQAVHTGLMAIRDPDKRLAELKALIEKHPNDPQGRAILVTLLTQMGRPKEAIREAERLRRDGFATPRIMEALCDLQAAAGRLQDAKRTCSELVEFNAEDKTARQQLGDIFLRHGWYEAAYRQYAGLVEMDKDNPISLLRLAAAAAGMGKVDEALRIERRVASGDGEPGPSDPRRFARLHSAAKLARMLHELKTGKNKSKVSAVERSLKQTQVFTAPTTIVLLVWEDLEAPLHLIPILNDAPFAVSEMVDAQEIGLVMLDLGQMPPETLMLFVQLDSKTFERSVPFTLLTISFDGKQFKIEETRDIRELTEEAA